jgi:hypothetical protein
MDEQSLHRAAPVHLGAEPFAAVGLGALPQEYLEGVSKRARVIFLHERRRLDRAAGDADDGLFDGVTPCGAGINQGTVEVENDRPGPGLAAAREGHVRPRGRPGGVRPGIRPAC